MKKNNSQKISVVIVTKNRARDLLECISSLLIQTEPLDELLIIDNNSADETEQIIQSLQRNCVIPIRYILEKKIGYPIVYNRGLAEVSSKWVAFIDDDCVADRDWYKSIKKAIQQFPDASAIVGKSKTYYSKNIFSLATSFFDQMWKKNGKDNSKIIDFATLDNKNIVYNKGFLFQNKLSFNENRLENGTGAAEDVDLGLRIQKCGGEAFFYPGMLVMHKDPITFSHFFQKLKAANQAARSVVGYISVVSGKRKYRIRNWFSAFCQQHEIKGLLKLRLLLLVLITVMWQKITRQE